MPFKLLEVTDDSEFEAIVSVEHISYDHPPCKLKQLFFPIRGPGADARETALRETRARQTAWHHAAPASRWIKVIETTSDKVVGAAQWYFYDSNPFSEPSTDECDWFPVGEERDAVNALMEQFLTPRMLWMRKPHALLEACFVLPEHRRQGVGDMLLNWGIKIADEKGLESYIDATDIGRPLYANHGFNAGPSRAFTMEGSPATATRAKMEEELLPFTWWPMFRPAKGSEGHVQPPWLITS